MLLCHIVYVYVCKICEEIFGGCWWSFSWLCQKLKIIYAVLADQVDLATSFCFLNGVIYRFLMAMYSNFFGKR